MLIATTSSSVTVEHHLNINCERHRAALAANGLES
jgi:hypothetical protein